MTDQQLERLFRELKRRGALRALQHFLTERELYSARSWGELEERVKKQLADGDLKEDEFRDFFIQLQLTAYKSYSLYEMGASDRKALVKAFSKLKLDSDLAKQYPFPVAKSVLLNADDEPTPIAVTENTAGTALILSSPRSYTSRTDILPEDLTPKARKEYSGARLFADRVGVFQAYDVIFVSRAEDYIQIRTDVGEDRLSEDAAVLQAEVKDKLEEIVDDAGIATQPTATDLFPAIRSMYDDKKEGRVSELHFDCSTGANRRETMSRRSAGDLRTESYHVAGKKAITAIAPYRISIAWNSNAGATNHEIEAHLPGTLRMLHNNGGLYSCYVPGLPSEDEVEFILSRVLQHA